MHKATLLPVIVLVAVAVGGLLYLYGGPSFQQSYIQNGQPANTPAGTTLLAQGDNASIQTRVNYRIVSKDQMNALWQMLYAQSDKPVPNVDFNNYEVLALFDGSHSTAGYGIKLSGLKDGSKQRIVTITHIAPGANCTPSNGITSPFVVIEVPKSSLPINRVEESITSACQ